MKNPKHRSTCL